MQEQFQQTIICKNFMNTAKGNNRKIKIIDTLRVRLKQREDYQIFVCMYVCMFLSLILLHCWKRHLRQFSVILSSSRLFFFAFFLATRVWEQILQPWYQNPAGNVSAYVCMYLIMYVFTYVCMYACMYLYMMYVCMHVCMYA